MLNRESLLAAARAKRAEIEVNNHKLSSIRSLMANLGTLPTLTKLREFLPALKALFEHPQPDGEPRNAADADEAARVSARAEGAVRGCDQ